MHIGAMVLHEVTGIEGEIVSKDETHAKVYASGRYFRLPIKDLKILDVKRYPHE